MFGSPAVIAEQIRELLGSFRSMAEGRYACLVAAKGILFEDSAPDPPRLAALRGIIEARCGEILALGRHLASDQTMDDVFAGWDHDELLVAVINERVALIVACPDAERLRDQAFEPLRAIADRLFRYDQSYQLNPRGGGFFFGRPKLDLIVVGHER